MIENLHYRERRASAPLVKSLSAAAIVLFLMALAVMGISSSHANRYALDRAATNIEKLIQDVEALHAENTALRDKLDALLLEVQEGKIEAARADAQIQALQQQILNARLRPVVPVTTTTTQPRPTTTTTRPPSTTTTTTRPTTTTTRCKLKVGKVCR